ncbi:MAG: hypothetical protein IJV65_05835 [Kiritimatiellae bacterium]|nr:hypothetical protein [Kiritimatiellia bacterium]
MTQNDVPEITLSGPPFEKGFAHGSLCRDRVLRSLETYRKRFAGKGPAPFSWADARAAARSFAPALGGEFAPYAEEMRGIAAGAGLDFEDVLALNLRSEILYSGLAPGSAHAPAECTAFAALPPATAGGAVFAGQTWDYSRSQREATVLARFPAEDGRPAMLMPLEAGMVGGKGVSAAGVCLTLNALSTPRVGAGIPLHVRMRRILEAPTADEAFRRAAEGPVAGPACLTVTSRDGRCVAFELDPTGVEELHPEGGLLVHTNHYVSLRFRPPDPPGGSTAQRYARLSALLRSRPDLLSADLERFLADHENGGRSICCHPAPDVPPERLGEAGSTNYAFVADLTAGRFRFVMGNPCEGEFRDLPCPLPTLTDTP